MRSRLGSTLLVAILGACGEAAEGGAGGARGGLTTSGSGGSGGAGSGGGSGAGGTPVIEPVAGRGGQGGSSGRGGTGGAAGVGPGGTGGTGGTGGSPCPAAGCEDGPLATDPGIFGAIPEGAFYVFREPYIRTEGNPPVVTAAINVADPGTRDLTFPNPPRWLPDGGPDGKGAAQFDGEDDYGTATGFSFGVGSTPSILTVLQYDDVTDRISVGVQLNDGTSNPTYFVHAAHIRTENGDLYRANAHPIGVPHNIDYLTPEASQDLAPHLHETHVYADGMVAVYDGTVHGGGGGEGMKGELNTLRIASNALGGPAGGQHAAVQISEIVITEGRTPAQAAAYREQRIEREYPSISLPQ